jgi:hypothetical protein
VLTANCSLQTQTLNRGWSHTGGGHSSAGLLHAARPELRVSQVPTRSRSGSERLRIFVLIRKCLLQILPPIA